MRRCLAMVVFTLFLSLLMPANLARAQGMITTPSAEYQFGDQILFQSTLHTSQPLKYALFYYRTRGSTRTNVKPADLSVQNETTYQLKYLLDLTEQPLIAFSTIEFYFEVTLQSGQILTSPIESLDYIDNRFDWRQKHEDIFQLHWYKGDNLFAQRALDAAKTGLVRIQTILPLSNPEQIDIYIYSSSTDMQETLRLSGLTWVAGHADPELGVIVVTLPPGPEQQMLTEQRIPHELMHILLYQFLGSGSVDLPAWLNEGLASSAELFPNPDYQVLLDNAYENGRLLPMATLCEAFPSDASGALLAYAQSASFVKYLQDRYGTDGLKSLVNEYSDGVNCDSGVKNTLGMNLAQLERQWRRERFRENVTVDTFRRLLPWLALMAAAMAAPITLIIGWLRRRAAKSPTPLE